MCRRPGLWQVLEKTAGPENYTLDYHLPKVSSEGLQGAQRRLLAVTRAFLLQPTILLLEEPTSGIDDIGRTQLAAILREICQGLTVIMVDHDVVFISQFADYICCLDQGKSQMWAHPGGIGESAGIIPCVTRGERTFYLKVPEVRKSTPPKSPNP